MSDTITLAVVGAGDRGSGYAGWALAHPERARVVAVAEPRAPRRERLAAAHGIDAHHVLGDWRELAALGRIADAVLVCTLDRDHLEPVLAFAALGYHIMLEKPMALTEDESPAHRRRRRAGGRHPLRRARPALHALHADPQGRRRLRPDRRRRERPAPGAGRLLAPGPLVRTGQLAARRRGDDHADGQVLPRPGLAPVRAGAPARTGLQLRPASPTSGPRTGRRVRRTAAWTARSSRTARTPPCASTATGWPTAATAGR